MAETVNWYYDMTPDDEPQRLTDEEGPQLVALCDQCHGKALLRGVDLQWAASGSGTPDLECYLCEATNNPVQEKS